jgi:hypothetical protein
MGAFERLLSPLKKITCLEMFRRRFAIDLRLYLKYPAESQFG